MKSDTEQAELIFPEQWLVLVRAILRKHLPDRQVLVFGSRVVLGGADRARIKAHSDIDLAITGGPLPLDRLFALREAFSESDLPMRVDIALAEDLPDGWLSRAITL